MKPAKNLTQIEISRQWNRIAKLRDKQIRTGKDLSYKFVLIPAILQLSKYCDFSMVIDIGCGNGYLTEQIAKKAKSVIGVDMSVQMIEIARKRSSASNHVNFINSTIERFARTVKIKQFSLAVSNMALMTTLHLNKTLRAIASLLKPNAYFIFTITHPWFWPFYHGYASQNWFHYRKEILVEDVFKISMEAPVKGPRTIHVHRPLEYYVSALRKAGFLIDEILEPMPSPKIEARYSKIWEYPRFLAVRCIRKSSIA